MTNICPTSRKFTRFNRCPIPFSKPIPRSFTCLSPIVAVEPEDRCNSTNNLTSYLNVPILSVPSHDLNFNFDVKKQCIEKKQRFRLERRADFRYDLETWHLKLSDC